MVIVASLIFSFIGLLAITGILSFPRRRLLAGVMFTLALLLITFTTMIEFIES